MGDTHRVTDQLKAEGADTLHFDLPNDGGFRITPVGLESGGGRSPRLAVQARLRILSGLGPDSQARVEIEVGLTRGSWARLLLWLALFAGPCIASVVQQPPSFGSFFLFAGFACVFIGVWLLRARALVARAWPGLLAVAQRVVTGSLYLPAA